MTLANRLAGAAGMLNGAARGCAGRRRLVDYGFLYASAPRSRGDLGRPAQHHTPSACSDCPRTPRPSGARQSDCAKRATVKAIVEAR